MTMRWDGMGYPHSWLHLITSNAKASRNRWMDGRIDDWMYHTTVIETVTTMYLLSAKSIDSNTTQLVAARYGRNSSTSSVNYLCLI